MSSALKNMIVKQVLSGDSLIVLDRSKAGRPVEKVLALSNIIAPRLARRPTANTDINETVIDEPYAWESREYIRQLCIGQEVWFQVESKAASGREYCTVFINNTSNEKENLAELIVNAGWAEVRRQSSGAATSNEQYVKLIAIEDAAKLAHRGKWGLSEPSKAVRNIQWNLENPAKYVESLQNKVVPAIIEHVRDGCTLRAFILPNQYENDNRYKHVTLILAGVKTPVFKQGENNEQIPEPLADEARFFVESKLLQRQVEIRLETVNNQNVVGTVIHPKGNIAEFILREGFGRIVDWSMGVLSSDVALSYRLAEKQAKEKRVRLWKDYEPPKTITELSSLNGKVQSLSLGANRTLVGKVMEVGNGDNISVKCADNQVRKFFLSSIKSPKLPLPTESAQNKKFKPLYDIPYLFEAREFLRKKLIGKKVTVRVDYIQPKMENMDEKVMATVTLGDLNVAEAIVVKGMATVIRYKATDENRSLAYDALLAAESTAQKKSVGLHSKKEPPTHRVSDLSGDASKSKQFFASLKRQGRMSGLVEFVASGSRLRVYVAKETCILTMLCAGIDGPRAGRFGESGDQFGDEALTFTKELCMQREVEVEVDSMDKAGNFIGWVYLEAAASTEISVNSNLSIALVDAGLAKVHFSAERTACYKQLCEAETKAKESRMNLWSVESAVTSTAEEMEAQAKRKQEEEAAGGRVVKYRGAVVTQIVDETRFYVQLVDNESTIMSISNELRTYFSEQSHHVIGAYRAKKGDLCAARFSLDGCWYRARVIAIEDNARGKSVRVVYIDYGNEETTDESVLATLPSNLLKISAQATEYCLAGVLCPSADDEAKQIARLALDADMGDKEVRINVEYDSIEAGGPRAASVLIKTDQDSWKDAAMTLIAEGIVYVDERRRHDKRVAPLLAEYLSVQDDARLKRLNIWRYGDFRNDDGPAM